MWIIIKFPREYCSKSEHLFRCVCLCLCASYSYTYIYLSPFSSLNSCKVVPNDFIKRRSLAMFSRIDMHFICILSFRLSPPPHQHFLSDIERKCLIQFTCHCCYISCVNLAFHIELNWSHKLKWKLLLTMFKVKLKIIQMIGTL